jgi:acyl-CoA synthetase (AMP-forming)/AMP-acid ligase II
VRYRHLIERSVRLYGPRPAIACAGVERSFREVHARACRLGNALLSAGLEPGDRVAVLLPNCPESLEIEIGLAQAGLVRVSLNVRAPIGQQHAVLEDADARGLVYAEALESTAEAILAKAAPEHVIRIGSGDPGGEVVDYERALAGAPAIQPPADPDPEDLFCLFYTSGTTGRPKGVMLSHRAQMAVAVSLLLEFGPVRPGEKALLTQPLSHGGGFFLLPWFMSGATSIVMPRFEPAECLELCERHAVETLKVVPTMLLQLLAQGVEARELPALRRVIYGASPMPAQRLGELIELFGPVFAQLYGQAEAPMCITVLPEQDHVGERLTSAGRPWRNVEVRVTGEDGEDVPVGEPGEVVVRGQHLMSGYWGQPELTGEVLRDGWIHTRDMARLDEQGYVYLLGRSDEMIISGGFNVAPRVVEEALDSHRAVHESFVMGMPHPTLGEEVTAFVALRPGQSATPEDLIDHTRDELGYQKPRTVWIVPELPRNAYGKVVKAELRDLLTAGSITQ